MTAQQMHYQPCEECGAPLDPQQRYCVNCAARRGNGANPASRYFAAMSKRARRSAARPPAEVRPTSRAAAVGFFALLPIAVALGVIVGRSGSSNNDQALLEALRRQDAAVAGHLRRNRHDRRGQQEQRPSQRTPARRAKGRSKVLASAPNGPIHQVVGFQADPNAEATKDNELVEKSSKAVGKGYAKQEQATCPTWSWSEASDGERGYCQLGHRGGR